MIYPNLIAEHQAFWCLEAMARGAEVTPELMEAVLRGGRAANGGRSTSSGTVHDV